ncbi:cardiolipin synthase [Rhizobium sp. CFBP 8762]|uniref:cardiolipin synthase n=1 Tax=Rhizobium sp. CFBP 8762 TaxID=2775279 RepID=UPI00177F2AAD|nr:cardiolipin synthase [Rhizobium sp. CFBP 8762]MBD8554225.1 cardiolipin synthase [Rhizobium sp. CFBP 8762]
MLIIFHQYWPHILFIVSVVSGLAAAIHATMTKEEVRSAIGWVSVIILSPIVGALIYAIVGINRIRRQTVSSQRALFDGGSLARMLRMTATDEMISQRFGERFAAMKTLGDRVTRHFLTMGNRIAMLETGDAAYGAMVEAINSAQSSILVETYIFDRDRIGLRVADALIAAVQRGVAVRVLIDAVGARYSVPSIVGYLRSGGVKVGAFNGNVIMALRLPYANLRTHRKIIVVDGDVAFTGGMNIREGFTSEFATEGSAQDTHFRVTGPVVADLFHIAAEDWRFTTGEQLNAPAWAIATPEPVEGAMFVRAVSSGPDKWLETNHKTLMGAFSVARDSILIMSPYFLPDRELISALSTAASRGVSIDIVVPAVSNLRIVDHAMMAQFDQVLKNDCRIWRAAGHFNHSKLMVIDDRWSYVGSSNLDPRSLRLNFEIDMEVMDVEFAQQIAARIRHAMEGAAPVTLAALRGRPFAARLADKILWLGSPYL